MWNVEDRTRRARSEHLIVHGLNKPTNALVGCKVTRWLEGKGLQIEQGWFGSRVVNRESFHDIRWVVLDEDLPIIDVGCIGVRPRHGRSSRGLRNVPSQIPLDRTIRGQSIACCNAWNRCGPICPCEIQPRPLRRQTFATGEGDEVIG